MKIKHALAAALCGLILGTAAAGPAAAQEKHQDKYPSKPIRWIVPFPPGALTDRLSRIIADQLTARLGQTVLVEYKPGASGRTGLTELARANPDGYTIGLGILGNIAMINALYDDNKYDAQKDLAPITQISSGAYGFIVPNALPVSSIKELVELAKAKPDSLNYASSGKGSTGHLSTELFLAAAGVRMTHITYRGGAQMMNDLVSGSVQVGLSPIVTVINLVQGKQVKMLATTGTAREKSFSDTPTVKEQGIDYIFYSWNGVFAPRGTPKHIIDRLNVEIAAALKDPKVRELLQTEGAEPVGNSSAEFAAFIADETNKWTKVISDLKKSGAQLSE